MNYKISYGGGAGDVYQQLFRSDSYANLMNLKPEDTVDILLICHNRFIKDFFNWHPKASQLNVICEGYWGPEHDVNRRRDLGLWKREEETGVPGPGGPVLFYPSPADWGVLKSLDRQVLGKKTVLVQATAGNDDRNIPIDQMKAMLADLKEMKDVVVIGLGKNYERGGRGAEFDYRDYPEVVSLVDKLSIPATIVLIHNRASGLIACHSCLCLMAWRYRVPNILTLPKAINHINGIGRGDDNEWTFGLKYPETKLVYSEDYTKEIMASFVKGLEVQE